MQINASTTQSAHDSAICQQITRSVICMLSRRCFSSHFVRLKATVKQLLDSYPTIVFYAQTCGDTQRYSVTLCRLLPSIYNEYVKCNIDIYNQDKKNSENGHLVFSTFNYFHWFDNVFGIKTEYHRLRCFLVFS